MVNKKTTAMLIVTFIGLLLAVALIQPIADSVVGQTSFLSVSGENIDISSARLADNNINETTLLTIARQPNTAGNSNQSITSFVLTNGTTTATNGTHYIIYPNNGTLTLLNTSFWVDTIVNTTSASYNWATDNYLPDATNRSLVSIILIFMAIAAFMFAVMMLFKSESFKDMVRSLG